MLAQVDLPHLPQALRDLQTALDAPDIVIQPDSAASLYLVPWVMDQARRAGYIR